MPAFIIEIQRSISLYTNLTFDLIYYHLNYFLLMEKLRLILTFLIEQDKVKINDQSF